MNWREARRDRLAYLDAKYGPVPEEIYGEEWWANARSSIAATLLREAADGVTEQAPALLGGRS